MIKWYDCKIATINRIYLNNNSRPILFELFSQFSLSLSQIQLLSLQLDDLLIQNQDDRDYLDFRDYHGDKYKDENEHIDQGNHDY